MSVTDPLASAPLEIRSLIRVADHLRKEFEGIFAAETIQRYMAESYDTLSGARVKGFVPLLVERYTRQRLRALARLEGSSTTDTPMIVFLCVHNAGRSQMAAGWMQHLAGDTVEIFSGARIPRARSTRPPSPRWRRSASTSRASSPSPGRMRSSARPTSS